MSNPSQADQLDEGIDALLAGVEGIAIADRAVKELLVVASELRTSACLGFKEQLKAELLESALRGDAVVDSRPPRVAAASAGREFGGTVPVDILPTLAGCGSALYPAQRRSFIASLGAHALIVALLVTSGIWAAANREKPVVTSVLLTDLSPYLPPPAQSQTGGGGGGGAH